MVIDCVKMAFRNMIRHGSRTVLTMIGIIVGTCSVIAVYSVGSGGRAQILDAFKSYGFSGVIVTAPSTAAFQSQDVRYIESHVDEVTSVMPLIYEPIRMGITHPTMSVTALGVGNNAIALSVAGAAYGRGFSASEINSAAKVCMIDSELALRLYHREDVVGRQVCLSVNDREEQFQIIGVISKSNTPIGSILGDSAVFVYVPYTTFFDLSGSSGFEAFIMSVDEDANADTASKKVMSLLEARSRQTGYTYENLSNQEETISSVIGTVTVIISAIAAVSLVVGGVGVMTIMLVAVHERRQEIGMKKAIGATNGNIMAEFMVEAVVLSVIGGLIGILLGYLLSLAAQPILGIISNFNMNIAICALLFCAVIGIIFSVYPAKKAAGLNPIECLKCE